MTSLGANPHSPGAVVAASAAQAGCIDEGSTGISVSRWLTREPDQLVAESFGSRVVCLQLAPVDAAIWANGRLVFDGPLPRGAWQVHAVGDSFRAVVRHGFELVRFVISEGAVERTLAGLDLSPNADAIELVDPGSMASSFLLAVGSEIKELMSVNRESSKLYADSLLANVLAYLLMRHSNVVGTRPLAGRSGRGGLPPWQVKKVTDHIEAHLAEEVGLADLASLTGLSSFHLCRAFKQSTGLPPHRWQLARRVDRAREMLHRTELSIAEVAAAVGYQDPNQFARVFRKALDTSPSAWRRDRCS